MDLTDELVYLYWVITIDYQIARDDIWDCWKVVLDREWRKPTPDLEKIGRLEFQRNREIEKVFMWRCQREQILQWLKDDRLARENGSTWPDLMESDSGSSSISRQLRCFSPW